ncbi:DUF429 domain-containing protein [Fervidobacterium riparium]|uniref:Predicted nuclease (RNAse H fold) n=1 Tax=Fervidobacterium gondwanense DSM 13020 TaxID=1121883 RepID=A0A1M7TBJ0_FERGO|nr:DUF429 domain-containing protein [Fervidobacterium gondwanense]UXF01778.1 hypothetical protein IB67_09705 [Fervidobacterium riparium]SHN68129.1 Predicted nuclease (RNAse H fold) [Fervidobacterium gondwanense DSM 13020]
MYIFKYLNVPEYYMGIDPSWTGKNKSAVVVLVQLKECDKCGLIDYIYTSNESEILDFVLRYRNSVLGIDAPLIVKNTSGHRQNELEFLQKYKLRVPLYPVNVSRWNSFFPTSLYNRLKKHEFSFENYNVFEIYPHATIAAKFFGKLFSYKRGSKSEREKKLDILKRIILKYVELPELQFQQLKEYEDFLDAVICAYTVFLPTIEETLVFGSTSEGLLLVPCPKS